MDGKSIDGLKRLLKASVGLDPEKTRAIPPPDTIPVRTATAIIPSPDIALSGEAEGQRFSGQRIERGQRNKDQ